MEKRPIAKKRNKSGFGDKPRKVLRVSDEAHKTSRDC